MIEWLTFCVIMAVGQFSPGPDIVLLTRVSLADGKRAGLATACGIACGLMIHAGIAVSGLALVLSQNEKVYRYVKYLACGYLFWLAFQLLSSAARQMKVELDTDVSMSSDKRLGDYWKVGFFCNILNPKVAIFLAGVIVPFLGVSVNVGIDESAWATLLWITVFLEGWLLWSFWVWMLQMPIIKRFYQRFAYVVDGVFGFCLLVLAGFLIAGF